MEYGILIAEKGMYEVRNVVDQFQLIGAVSSVEEAKEMARMYLQWADPNVDICPDRFVIHRRDIGGEFRVREEVDLEMVGA